MTCSMSSPGFPGEHRRARATALETGHEKHNRSYQPMTARQASVALVPLPTTYKVWLLGNLLSRLGDATLFFALGWVATESGGVAAGLVLTSVAAPRTLLLLVGG